MAGVLENRQELEFSDRPVPPDQRMGKLSLSMAWWSVCSAMFYLVIAASLALAYGARNAIIGLVLSVVTYAAVNAVLVRHAIRTGLSVALFSRVLLGRSGASVATLIFFATAIYYAVFEGSVIAVALREYAGLSYPVAALVVVVYSVALIFGSIQNWLDRFNGVLLPFYLLGLGAAGAGGGRIRIFGCLAGSRPVPGGQLGRLVGLLCCLYGCLDPDDVHL